MTNSESVGPERSSVDAEDPSNVDQNVFDEAAAEEIDDVAYDISYSGVDLTVDAIVTRLRKEVFFIPPFQRSFLWTTRQCSRFIESLLLGLPVPGIFLAHEPELHRYLVIDGQQRLQNLQCFFLEFFVTELFVFGTSTNDGMGRLSMA